MTPLALSVELTAAIRQLVDLFLVNGYAFSAKVVPTFPDTARTAPTAPATTTNVVDARGTKLAITLNAPATIWGGKILQNERAALSNDFLVKAINALISRLGYSVSSSIKYDGTTEEISLQIL